MRKYALNLTLLLFFVSCVEQSGTLRFENLDQQKFDDFLRAKKSQEFEQRNDIQRREFRNAFDEELNVLLDSMQLFTNWKGRIKNIRSRLWGGSTEISFVIYYEPEKYREVNFYSSYWVKNELLDDDYIYNKVKQLSDYSTVYFDGFISRDNRDNVNYSFGDYKVSYPNYVFNTLEISKPPISSEFSEQFKNAINAEFQIIQLLKQKVNKEISERDWELRTKEINIDEIQKSLTVKEQEYIGRLRQYLVNDFMAKQ